MANIFFIMPFRPGLNFMFLHMKHFIERTFEGTRCVRGDAEITTGMLIDKIRSNIEEADVIIADLSGQNPNVLYELGVAHALGKQVVLIHDSVASIPTDIRGYELLPYGFNDDDSFCNNVRKALQQIIRDKYQILYDQAFSFIDAFNRQCGKNVPVKNAAIFRADLMSRESAKKLPPLDDQRKLAIYLMPSIADGTVDLELATEMKLWIDKTYSAKNPPRSPMIISCQVLPARSACVATSRAGHRSYHVNIWNGSWLRQD